MSIELDSYGIMEGINEVIVTTKSIDDRPNAAPIGLIRRNGRLTVRIYNESHTCTNIKDTGLLAVNIVDDPIVFVRSALEDLDKEKFEFIETGTGINFPVLASSNGWVIFKAGITEGDIATTAELQFITGNIKSMGIRPINRGFNAVIEAAIYATRYKVFNDETFLSKIKSYEALINKCGGRSEKEAYSLINRLLLIKC
ncbi:MAG: DUF447 family protein [ANME-2 cluster archaeon]|nr:DUF447 family protein [ANME-2 cluster archaeon]MBC2700792.1 DUF447 family protein [ANME-2 cluster archaeon]MBC2707541.1 DUF447 family protein [ANME-2 cluster archaeon]MBC2745884.1 DUF447 family protein [ANME-2 cluster archaeon]MBC2764059.1 DUF447 family protein [ANME-2 cluster archaeon]